MHLDCSWSGSHSKCFTKMTYIYNISCKCWFFKINFVCKGVFFICKDCLTINGFNIPVRANCTFDMYSYNLYILFIHVDEYYCISCCTICENTRFAKTWLLKISCTWYFAIVPDVFHGIFLHISTTILTKELSFIFWISL